ncbi:DNA segregation ATPase FtsK/SpoIIIE or related protein [Streptococcus pneumoniae]|nr:DNA segregation ATPase FtsK/SpoIIIE or related protein [Streptococcus pneumoniae]
MALGEYATISDVEDFRGYYVSDGLTKQPQKFYVPNIFKNGLNEIDAFKKASERRESHAKQK